MKQPDSTKFLYRQYMLSQSYELYYYRDHPVRGRRASSARVL